MLVLRQEGALSSYARPDSEALLFADFPRTRTKAPSTASFVTPDEKHRSGLFFYLAVGLCVGQIYDIPVSTRAAGNYLEMKFNLKKQSTKTFKTLSECCISAEELIEIFGEGIDINPKLIDRVKNAVTITTHQPPALDVPSEVTIDETLIR